ncbi:hypothetical protein [Nocardiopsis sp. LOL_012]|uniref:hypothetical protein n=1 Tax=Nocardiopsis sp. LOL_012 TaxID=3345409 RepID=UPI003A86A78F
MRYRITFAAGLAIGYVLGAKAGRARYDQLVRSARKVADNPAVQEAAGLVGAQVGNAGRTVYDKAVHTLPVSSVRDFLRRPTEEEMEFVDWEEGTAKEGAGGPPDDVQGR